MAALEDLLDPGYPGPLAERSLADLRSMRAECQDVETGLSLLRRVVQGHLDIVGAELRRREAGADAGDLTDLIERLPETLADRTHAPGVGRLPQLLAPESVDPSLEAELNELVGPVIAVELSGLDDGALHALVGDLGAFEHTVSGRRRSLFDRIDVLQDEITRRYRTGEASVDTLLS
jgi:hypothetical protein